MPFLAIYKGFSRFSGTLAALSVSKINSRVRKEPLWFLSDPRIFLRTLGFSAGRNAFRLTTPSALVPKTDNFRNGRVCRHRRQKSAVYVSLSCVSEGRWLVGAIGSGNVCFETRWLGKKLRSLPPLPKGSRDLTVLAHRQRSSRLKEVPTGHFQQDRVEDARAASHAEATQARHTF